MAWATTIAAIDPVEFKREKAMEFGATVTYSSVAEALGVVDPPRTEEQLRQRISQYRPELRGTAAAREAARFLLLTPPLPLVMRGPYGVLAATSISLLPGWARAPLWLPYVPPVEATVIKMAGNIVVGGIRWVMTAAQAEDDSAA